MLYEAASTLCKRRAPEHAAFGIARAPVSFLIGPILGWAKLGTARAPHSRALEANSKEPFVCAYLSFAVLLGPPLNALLGWWRADPPAVLGVVPRIVHQAREAREGARGEPDDG